MTAKIKAVSPVLRFNRKETKRFIGLLEKSCRSSWNFRCIPETKQCRSAVDQQLPRMKFHGTFAQHEAMLRKRNTQGYAIYYSLNIMRGGVKAQHCRAVRAIPLDLDDAPLPATWARGIKPQIVVETSPGRYQCLFLVFLTKPCEFDAAEDVGRRLAGYYGGDASVADRARVLRLPGFAHQKRKPFISRVISANPELEESGQYTLEDFSFLPALPKRSPSCRGQGKIGVRAAKLLFKHYPVEALSGNAAWLTFAMALHSACGGNEKVAELFFEFCMTDEAYGVEDDERNRLRWSSFTADKDGGLTIGTLRKLCYEARVPAAVRFKLFNTAKEDFKDV